MDDLAELHLHLEGSLSPETLHELDPSTSVEELRAFYQYADFNGFLKAFGEVSKRLRCPEDYALATRRLAEHAGEGTSPRSVWAALELGAERIGHCISSIGDSALLRHLRDYNIPLEICITSNLVTGVVKRIEDHPVRRLYDAGVPIILNT